MTTTTTATRAAAEVRQNFLRALDHFADAAAELDQQWPAGLEDYDTEYPFARSFDEMVGEIAAWRDSFYAAFDAAALAPPPVVEAPFIWRGSIVTYGHAPTRCEGCDASGVTQRLTILPPSWDIEEPMTGPVCVDCADGIHATTDVVDLLVDRWSWMTRVGARDEPSARH